MIDCQDFKFGGRHLPPFSRLVPLVAAHPHRTAQHIGAQHVAKQPVLSSKMGRIVLQNGPFRTMKRAVLDSETGRFGSLNGTY